MSFEYTTPTIELWKLDIFMKAVDEFEDKLADKTHHQMQVSNDYKTILLHIAGKSILTTREILTLCAHGYPNGALSLGRNLYEQMMIVAFFEMHKNDTNFQEYIDDFFLSYEVQRNRCLHAISKYIPEGNNGDIDTEYEKLKKRAHHKIRMDYWWADCDSFSKLVSSVMEEQDEEKMKQFLGVHYARYKKACVTLHAGCMGNTNRIGNNTGFGIVDTSVTVHGHSTPLIYATISLISIIGFVCSLFEIDSTEHLKQLNELAVFYQDQEIEDISNNF